MGGEGLILEMQTSGRAMSNLFGRRPHRAAMLWLVGCALVPLLAGGCAFDDGLSRVVEVTPSLFNRLVLQSQQPVLVNFYKPG
jgi:hypothetical protein